MLILKIIPSNLTIIQHLNAGVKVRPEREATYFVMETGEPNRIVNYKELHELTQGRPIFTSVRKFSYV